MESTGTPAQFLKAQLLGRVSQNPSYSVRAFARDLKISHSYLSQLLNGRRGVSLRQALLISNALALKDEDRQRFMQLLFKNPIPGGMPDSGPTPAKSGASDTMLMDLDRFRMVKEWYHGAIVEMTTLKNFRADFKTVARQLGLTSLQVRAAVNRLRRIGVLEIKGKKWKKTSRRFQFPTTSLQEAVNGFHQAMIYKALCTLEKKGPADFEARDITGMTIAIDPTRIPEAKKRIQRFRNQLADFLCKGEPSEVYQLNVQLFALTQRKHDLH